MIDQAELLEYGLVQDIPKTKARYEQLLKFHWDYYSELAFQRSQIYDSLKSSLRERAAQFQFTAWQRAVKYRYSLDPLGTRGSLMNPGGRFNIGKIDATRFPIFPALYLASDRGTALAELLGRNNQNSQLTPEELALTKPGSVTAVSVSGELESILDVRDPDNLADFMHLVKDFDLSSALIERARKLGILQLGLVRTPQKLVEELLHPNWRFLPIQLDIPSNSQIFGRIAMDAGMEGILYTSVLTGKPCLVVYPQNFANTSSFVQIDDEAPNEAVRKRIDASTFKNFV